MRFVLGCHCEIWLSCPLHPQRGWVFRPGLECSCHRESDNSEGRKARMCTLLPMEYQAGEPSGEVLARDIFYATLNLLDRRVNYGCNKRLRLLPALAGAGDMWRIGGCRWFSVVAGLQEWSYSPIGGLISELHTLGTCSCGRGLSTHGNLPRSRPWCPQRRFETIATSTPGLT